jgi:5-(hydroxymethyl)furfural/furfural oxidase
MRTIATSEVIVACGALHSAALLLRSGIGPEKELRSLGIEVQLDLRGVGRNLQNHPALPLVMHLQPAGMQSASQCTWPQNLVRYSSKAIGCAEHDMLLLPVVKSAWHELGRHIATLLIIVNKAYSQGIVELVSADPAVAPRVRFNLLNDPRDFERLVQGLKMVLEALCEDELTRLRNEVFAPDSAIAARLTRHSTWTGLQATLLASALRIGPLRRAALRKSTLNVRAMLRDENAIRNYVRQWSQAVYHVCGTCRMGRAEDPEAVVDMNCRVLGIAGLRVIDASIFPTVPAAAIHLPVLMVAEKMSDRIKDEWQNHHYSGGARAA